ncbi:synaptopodin 2-like protein [Lampris incognitus]|uniref:synaptopodin 2-like protein n=1 Tax=Lampris incognitus TaxID=2546036 RepID=UPI0024B5D23C|nr:synaptopodin 2-like protein [Lampris incognitus]
MVAEEVIITLSGGAPWGFRLQGGVEHQKPLQVAKVRKRSKACRAGLREADELVSINDQPCETLSHAQAMNLIDSSPGILHIRVKRAPVGFQSVVLLTRAPSPRIDKEYRAVLRAMSPSHPHHTTVREIHRSRSSLASGLTSPPGSEAYYGETDSDADVAAYERQRRQKRRSPSNTAPGKPSGRASPEGGETSEMSGYDSAPDAHICPKLLEGHMGTGGGGGRGTEGEGLPGVARKEVIYQPPAPGMWSSQTSTETSSIISSTDDQGPRDGAPEEDSGFLEPANVPLVSPERAKGALLLGSRSQLVPMVGPLDKPIDEELTTTYMEKAKQAKLNRGETLQDKHVKEAKTKCRTIASLLTDAPNPHSKGVLMFKKRRQRSKKYTLTSFGSVDEDVCRDSQEEDGVFPGSESEFDEDGFSALPDPTWDSDYLDMLEKRAAAGLGGRGDGAEDAPSPGLSDTAGKGAQLFEQQRKRAAEHAKKVEAAQPQAPTHTQSLDQTPIYQQSQMQPQTQAQMQLNTHPQQIIPKSASSQQGVQQMAPQIPVQAPVNAPAHNMANGDVPSCAVRMEMSPPAVAPKPTTASVTILASPPQPAETPLPELSSSNVLNRTARPFAPGFITSRAATAPVAFRPTITKKAQRPASAAVITPPFTTSSELAGTVAPVISQSSTGPPSMFLSPTTLPEGPVFPMLAPPVPPLPSGVSTPVENMQATYQSITITTPQAQFTTVPTVPVPTASCTPIAPAPVAPVPQALVSTGSVPHVSTVTMPPVQLTVPLSVPDQVSMAPVAPVSVVSQPNTIAPTPVPGTASRTGILVEARRRSGKSRPMFNVPDVKKNSPNPELLTMVQNLDDRPVRHRYGYPPSESYNGAAEDTSDEAGRGRMPPPVAPKPRVIHETPQIPQAEGKGAQLFARRQSRMGMYVVDTPPETPYQQEVSSYPSAQHRDLSPNPSLPSQWKYSPNIRAPPPIGYNPLLAPSVPVGPQRGLGLADGRGRGGMATQKEGIKALDFMRRQPYQLNSAMFSYGGNTANMSAIPSYQAQRQQQQQGGHTTMVGSSLTSPRQIPVKAARVYEIKRFSTPTPMSAPTLTPKVISPRSATTLGERLTRSDMISPPLAPLTPLPAPTLGPAIALAPTFIPAPGLAKASAPSQQAGLPSLPKISATPIPNLVPNALPTPYTPTSYTTGLQGAKQFQSAPELSLLSSLPPLRPNPVQVPKPRFVATKVGVQPHIWRPGAL